jgi:hypothetical protein
MLSIVYILESGERKSASDLLLRKMNLAGWLHPHFALTCPQAIQRLVRERDNFFRRQGFAILGLLEVAKCWLMRRSFAVP